MRAHLRSLDQVQIGWDTITRLSDRVLRNLDRRARPLEALYPIVYASTR
jgi:hypothetical protein